MIVKDLKKILSECKDECEIIIFALNENRVYRPFKNIDVNIFDKGSFNESLHFDISVFKEFKSIHFPNNLTKEALDELFERRDMLLEELSEIDDELKGYL